MSSGLADTVRLPPIFGHLVVDHRNYVRPHWSPVDEVCRYEGTNGIKQSVTIHFHIHSRQAHKPEHSRQTHGHPARLRLLRIHGDQGPCRRKRHGYLKFKNSSCENTKSFRYSRKNNKINTKMSSNGTYT